MPSRSGIWIAVVITALISVSCTELLVDGEGLRTPERVFNAKVTGNSLTYSADGKVMAVWVNENLDHSPYWTDTGVWFVDPETLEVLHKVNASSSSTLDVQTACLNNDGTVVYYAIGLDLYMGNRSTSRGTIQYRAPERILSMCYDKQRNVVYFHTPSGSNTAVYQYNPSGFPQITQIATINEGAYWSHGSKRMRMVGPDLLMTPMGVAIDIPSRTLSWSLDGLAAYLSPTRLVYFFDQRPYLIDVTKEDHLGYLDDVDEIFYGAAAAASVDGSRFAVAYNTSSGNIEDLNYVAVFDATNGEALYELEWPEHSEEITDLEFDPTDAHNIVVVDRSGNLFTWRLP